MQNSPFQREYVFAGREQLGLGIQPLLQLFDIVS